MLHSVLDKSADWRSICLNHCAAAGRPASSPKSAKTNLPTRSLGVQLNQTLSSDFHCAPVRLGTRVQKGDTGPNSALKSPHGGLAVWALECLPFVSERFLVTRQNRRSAKFAPVRPIKAIAARYELGERSASRVDLLKQLRPRIRYDASPGAVHALPAA